MNIERLDFTVNFPIFPTRYRNSADFCRDLHTALEITSKLRDTSSQRKQCFAASFVIRHNHSQLALLVVSTQYRF